MHDHRQAKGAGDRSSQRALLSALVLTLGFAVVEAVAGWWSGSLALLGDAGHMLTDSLAMGLAAAAAMIAARAPSLRHSYGLGRAEILAALANASVMIGVVAWLAAEAVQRLTEPVPIKGAAVMVVAAIGLLINLAAAWLLSAGRHNVNVRAALLHVMGDLLGSVAALVSGSVILLSGWTTIDPLLSLLIAGLIAVSALRVLRETLHALMEGVPLHLDLAQIGDAMAAIDGVVSIHDLHVWTLSSTHVALSAHVVLDDMDAWPRVLDHLRTTLDRSFGIDHVTLQPELSTQRIPIDALVRRGSAGLPPTVT